MGMKNNEYVFKGEGYITTNVNIGKWNKFSASLELNVPSPKDVYETVFSIGDVNEITGILKVGPYPREGFVSLQWYIGGKNLIVPIKVKKWNHIVVTADSEGKKIQLFLNHTLVGESISLDQLWDSDASIIVGGNLLSSAGMFRGGISNLKFYEAIMSIIGDEYVEVIGKEEELFKYRNDRGRRSVEGSKMMYDIIGFNPNRLSVNIEAAENGYFYFGDGYSKHWKVFLNSKEVKIYKTNVNFKSVYVPKGKHRVDFVYDPAFLGILYMHILQAI